MKKVLIISLIILALVIIGIFLFFGMPKNTAKDNTQNQPDNTNTPSSQPKTIEISNFVFSPSTLNVKVGDTLVWTNKDLTLHTVTSDSGSELNSASLSNGDSYSHTFNTAGEFSYHCSFHTSMKGKIVVQ